ncbi:MAG: hypothetical protein OXN83_04185, partial [Oligoflexia bacterium]|nr:hypothetical protein [Oligoflexia bacterium]
MFKVRQIVIWFLLGTVWSCGQDPLKGFPEEFHDGVLKTGSQQFANYEDIVVKELIKINIVGSNNGLTMQFSEGSFNSYYIHFRLLGLQSEYEFEIENNPFARLTGSKWSYDSEKRIGLLEWKPSETFTQTEMLKAVNVPLSIQVRKLGPPNKDSRFPIKRDILVVVKKNFIPPRIYRVETEYDSYIKLDDDNFYRDYQLSALNLNYYETLFRDDGERVKAGENLIFYTSPVFQAITERQYAGNDKPVDLYDRFGKAVPEILADFIQQTYYQAVEETEDVSCIKERPDFLTASLCLMPLAERDSVALDANLYVKNYKIPPHVSMSDLYYKVESSFLCDRYYELTHSFISSGKKEFQGVCYLSLERFDQKRTVSKIAEGTKLYTLKGDGGFERMDQSEWPANFEKIKEFVKWQLGGHQPHDTLPVYLIREASRAPLSIYIEDSNYSGAPRLILERKWISPWKIPLSWGSIQVDKGDLDDQWELKYWLRLDSPLEEDKYNKLYQYFLAVKPDSASFLGSSVNLRFDVFPSVKLNHIESFNPEDLELSTQVKHSGDFQEWVNTTFSIKTQTKQQYVFSSNFKDYILQVLPKGRNHSQKSLMDFLTLAPSTPHVLTKNNPFFENTSYECSDFEVVSNDNQEPTEGQESADTYIESICSYTTELELNTEHVNQDNRVISAYWKYNYWADTLASLKNESADGKEDKRQKRSLDINSVYLYQYDTPTQSENDRFNIHIFFNLKPDINCFSKLDSLHKTCEIKYYLDESPDWFILEKLNQDESFFSAKGLQAEVLCLNDENITIESCSCNKPVFAKEKLPVKEEVKAPTRG